jgi:hypothetical protein
MVFVYLNVGLLLCSSPWRHESRKTALIAGDLPAVQSMSTDAVQLSHQVVPRTGSEPTVAASSRLMSRRRPHSICRRISSRVLAPHLRCRSSPTGSVHSAPASADPQWRRSRRARTGSSAAGRVPRLSSLGVKTGSNSEVRQLLFCIHNFWTAIRDVGDELDLIVIDEGCP